MANHNLLVCGGMPRAATTFCHDELSKFTNVRKSRIKESHLFDRKRAFIAYKLKHLSKTKLNLDFTPTYMFNDRALGNIDHFNIPVFFIFRDFNEWQESLFKYASINSIALGDWHKFSIKMLGELEAKLRTKYLCFDFNEVINDRQAFYKSLENSFQIDLGIQINSDKSHFKKNSSATRNHVLRSYLVTKPVAPITARFQSLLMGII